MNMNIVFSPAGRLLFVGTTGVSHNRSALARRLMHAHSGGKMTSMALTTPALPHLSGGIMARHRATSTVLAMPTTRTTFSFAGPRVLDDVIKTSLLENKTGSELADIWCSYHETKDHVIGIVMKGADGENVLRRASQCPFFVQPVFRDDGFFMMVSQFQAPSHFLMAYLEDYKMDPSSATPLLTFSVFDDYSESKGVTLVRCDILNNNLDKEESLKVVESVLENYKSMFGVVQTFNERPNSFDINDYISRMNYRWKQGSPGLRF